ncbi:MAG: CRISPR-associated helicase Cas3' [Peptococcaceae bacterium]|jgi:CRISPR-associated endonuclease/helicase Cas3|nr:CRISPR-associated helicase Cas3' [Peptococcaceae bacterium]
MNEERAFLLRQKYPEIVVSLARRANVSLRRAMDMLYSSETYDDIINGVSDMHCRSDEYLAEEVLIEYREYKGERDLDQYIAHTRDDNGKQSVIDHLKGTAELAAAFAEVFGGEDIAYVCGLLHDLGKYSERFQRRIRGVSLRVDHSTAGGQMLWKKSGKAAFGLLAAYCVLGHHSGLPDGGSQSQASGDESTLFGRLDRVVEDYSSYRNELEIPELKPPDFPIRSGFDAAFFIRMIFSALVDADYLDTERFKAGLLPRGGHTDIPALKKRLFEGIDHFLYPSGDVGELNLRRTALLKDCIASAEHSPGLFTLTAPTGSGKTTASLAFALVHASKYGKRRIIYVAPYNTIIEQNAAELEKLLGAENVLQHHFGVRYDDDHEEMDRKRYSAENWDFPLIATSSVRFFESLFASRPSDCRKLHNIADSVIVFDEAQMLPLPYLIPCVRAMGELVRGYGCTVVLATATQSALERYFGDIQSTEIASNPEKLYEILRRAAIRQIPEPLTDDALAARLCQHSQVLCIVNSRKHAQALFHKLPADGAFHLSTTMYPAHRGRALSEIRARLKDGLSCRVVSTSLVEAGVDLDFPAVYRAVAGLDSIIQAAGRCNREGKHPADESVVYVFTSAEHNPPPSIKPNIAAASQAVRGRDDIASPDAIKAYFEQLFYNKGNESLDSKDVVSRFDAGLRSFSFPFRTVSKEFRIIEENTQIVFVPREAPELANRLRGGERTRELFRELARYSVSLTEEDVSKLNEIGAVEQLDSDVRLLADDYYDERFGVNISPRGDDTPAC